MRIRLIVAFIVVALLTAVATAWVINLVVPWYPWLGNLVPPIPRLLSHLLYTGSLKYHHGHPSHGGVPPPPGALAFCLIAGGVLLAAIAGLAFAASRRVLLPVRRLARAAQRMSGGDLSVRIEPKGRDELAQLTTTFNGMAAALEGKISELERMEARALQFAGDVSHELRTPLTAMTAVADILPGHPGLTGDAAAAAQLVSQEIRHLNRLVHDLIEISRFDAGTAQLVTDNTDVAAAVAACLRARGWADVDTDIPAGLTMPLDRRRFDVILANLIGNALCHGSPPVTVQASIQPANDGRAACPAGPRPRPWHPPGSPAARVRTVLQGRYRPVTVRGQRAWPSHRLGEHAPARRAHRGRQRSRRRRAPHAVAASPPDRACHAARRRTGDCDALVTLRGPGQYIGAASLRACMTQPHLSHLGHPAPGPPGSGPCSPWRSWPRRRCWPRPAAADHPARRDRRDLVRCALRRRWRSPIACAHTAHRTFPIPTAPGASR